LFININAMSSGRSELGTFEWWISGLMLDLPFFLISRLKMLVLLLLLISRLIKRAGLRISYFKVFSSDSLYLKWTSLTLLSCDLSLEWDTFNPDCLIRISNVDTYNFLLNPIFFGYSTEKSKTGFSKLERVPSVSV